MDSKAIIRNLHRKPPNLTATINPSLALDVLNNAIISDTVEAYVASFMQGQGPCITALLADSVTHARIGATREGTVRQ
ncbi:hypothetical protein GmHk_14G041174 [Glycine max]|nr:hypothetical protein GmHk_14G041174 [Glycine max]